MKENEFTEENFGILLQNLNDFEEDIWSLSHTAFALNFCVSEAMHCHQDEEGLEKMNHLSWLIDILLESLSDLSSSALIYLTRTLKYKPYIY